MSRRSSSTPASRADSRNLAMRAEHSARALRVAGRRPPMNTDRAAERLVVGGIGDELEIAHEIANLSPIVEAHRADDAIGQRALAQRLLDRAALRIRAVEDGEVAERQRGRLRAACDELLDDEVRLVTLVETAGRRDALPAPMRGAQRLAHPPLVGADDDVGEVEDFRRAAVVLLEANDVRLREILVEVEDVPDVGAAPSIDRLVVVTDDADVAVSAGEELDELILRVVRVLILVDEDVLELAPVLLELGRILGEEANGKDEQIVEVH